MFPVARGSIKKVEQQEEHSSVTVEISRLYRQKTQVFVSGGVRVRSWTGHIKMPLQCGVRSGEGEFLFTGTVRFGEAWMGCAPRYKDFLRLYHEAEQQGTNPCHVDTDWRGVTCPRSEIGQVTSLGGDESWTKSSCRGEKRLTDWPGGSASLLSSCLVTLLETKNGAPECCQAACQLDSVLKVQCDAKWNVFGLPFLTDEELPGFKCSRPCLVSMCIKCEWTLYILKLCVLCKKLDVQSWSYFLWQKCIKWKPLIFILFKKLFAIQCLNLCACQAKQL